MSDEKAVVEEVFEGAEKDLAIKHGLSKKEETEGQEQKDDKEVTKEEEISFEAVDKDNSKLKDFSKNEQALYWKWKQDKAKRQEAQAKYEQEVIRSKSVQKELDGLKNNASLTVGKLKKIETLLNGEPDNITVEAIQAILGEEKVETKKEEEKPLTKKDLIELKEEAERNKAEQAQANKKVMERLIAAEKYGKESVDDFENIMAMAQEVLEGKVDIPEVVDIDNVKNNLIVKVSKEDFDNDEIIGYVKSIARLNPNYGKKKELKENKNGDNAKKATSQEIDKIIKNSEKVSSAKVSGGNQARRATAYDEMTSEDASKLTPEEYAKVPREIRRRWLSE